MKNDISRIKKLLLIHITAQGPVSFESCLAYVRMQGPDDAEDYQLARALTELIREDKVELGDDGVTFE